MGIRTLNPRTASTRARAARALATATLLVALPCAAAPAAVAAAPPDEDPSLQQTVEADEEIVDEAADVTDGHVDVGPRFVDGEWTVLARDDRTYPPVWRAPENVIYQLGDASVLPAPDSPDYEFLGVEPGTPLHVIPQTQAPDVPWLGWNTQHPGVVDRLGDGASMRLDAVHGPGEVIVFLQEGVSGPPNVLWRSGQPLPQELFMETNSHVHANWVFTEPGAYVLDIAMTAELADGEAVEAPARFLMAVGEDTTPDDVRALAAETAANDDAAPADPAVTGDGSDGPTPEADLPADPAPGQEADGATGGLAALADGPWGPAVWAVPAALLLAAVLVAGAVRTRRAKAAADRDEPASGSTGASTGGTTGGTTDDATGTGSDT